ncbi:MAG: hypothetical protein PHC88_03895 [Terrimicrobiaceae bacterium]|nr:hypothetical protein [Terrimicrobiaceae bacterium]
MASLIPKNGSRFWHKKFKDAEGIWRSRSTGLLRVDARQTADARVMKAELDAVQINQSVDIFNNALRPRAFSPLFPASEYVRTMVIPRRAAHASIASIWLAVEYC